jgi:hypothetical protein
LGFVPDLGFGLGFNIRQKNTSADNFTNNKKTTKTTKTTKPQSPLVGAGDFTVTSDVSRYVI